MRAVRGVFLLSMVVAVSAMQSPEPPLSEMRLTVHTLLREDIFAGFMSGNMDRFARGERNIDALLQSRPDQKANLLAWKASAQLYRAVLAHEAKKADEVKQLLSSAVGNFSEAGRLSDGNDGVTRNCRAVARWFIADRLPEPYRSQLWAAGLCQLQYAVEAAGCGDRQAARTFQRRTPGRPGDVSAAHGPQGRSRALRGQDHCADTRDRLRQPRQSNGRRIPTAARR